MAKGGIKAFALLGFIIGAAGLGLSGYIFYMYGQEVASLKDDIGDLEQNIEERSSVHRTWFVQSSDLFKTDPGFVFLDVSSMFISFWVEDGESVYFLFTCLCKLRGPSPWPANFIAFYLEVDGHRQGIKSEVLNYGESGYEHYTIPLQYVNNTLSSGNHSVQVITHSYDDQNAIVDRTLLVQTFIP